MEWDHAISEFKAYLKLEKSLSDNSIAAYLGDIGKLRSFCMLFSPPYEPDKLENANLHKFIEWLDDFYLSSPTQSRIISGIRAFYKFMLMNEIIGHDPSALLEMPKTGRKLPVVLSIGEIDALISAIDLSTGLGRRNKAIIELMYSGGLRVSELVNLRIDDVFFRESFLKITGKGNKMRLVPVGSHALREISNYLQDRNLMPVAKGHEDILFLNRRGKKLTRVMIFTVVRQLATRALIKKKISPHTFRHSFATHLVEGGADLRAVQEMLGHESIITTEIYTHLDRSYLSDTINMYHPRSRLNREK
jgi:integrase/recombinase XerD